MHAAEASDDAERDGAVAADDQRPPPSRNVLRDGVGYFAGDRDDGGEIARTRVLVIDGKDRAWQVAAVGDADAGGPQPLDQPRGPQRGRRPVLARVVRPGAGRYSDQHPVSPAQRRAHLASPACVTSHSVLDSY